MPEITVIVTTHHRPDYLFRCLLAIKLQTFEDFECIIVADNCGYAEKVYNEDCFCLDERFKFYNIETTERNNGTYGKNYGIEKSTTNYISYCDDDNILLYFHLQFHHELMTDTNKQLIYTNFFNVDHKNTLTYDILNKDLFYAEGAYITNKDLLGMCHTKQLAYDAGMWKPMLSVGYNTDGYFMREMKEYIKNDFYESKAVTAIYNEHWVDMGSKIKEHEEYKNALINLQGTYVYSELVDKLKNKWL